LGSEALFFYDISIGLAPVFLLLVATLGNTLGGVVNYWFGFKGEELILQKGLIKKERLDKASDFFSKYGGYSLLFSWVPIIGDPITFVAGVLKYDIKKFLFFVTLAKFGRYLFLLVGYIYFFTD
jgi:membrane protein YqaA with SNARE-associated domain